MLENLFLARQIIASDTPGAPALVRHFMKYSSCNIVLLWGDFGANWLEHAGGGGNEVEMIELPATGNVSEDVLDRLSDAHAVLIAKPSKEGVLATEMFRKLTDRCDYTFVLGTPAKDFLSIEGVPAPLQELASRLIFSGSAMSKNGTMETISVFLNEPPPQIVPSKFRVAAILAAHNEADVIVHALEHLIAQEVDVYFMDNWSTDGTYEQVCRRFCDRLIGVERFPLTGSASAFDLYELLKRKEELAQQLDVDWIMHHDADEFRYAPFEGRTMRHGIYIADQAGFNAINYTVIEFPPTADGSCIQGSPESALHYFRFGHQPSDLVQVKTWKKIGAPIFLASSAGHQVDFDGRRICPYNFLLKHYPIRSQEQGSRKVFQERLPRYSSAGIERGWHVHYTELDPRHRFAEEQASLEIFDSADFHSRFLVQRVTGCGVGPLRKHLESSI
jgi:hypothetical protein